MKLYHLCLVKIMKEYRNSNCMSGIEIIMAFNPVVFLILFFSIFKYWLMLFTSVYLLLVLCRLFLLDRQIYSHGTEFQFLEEDSIK